MSTSEHHFQTTRFSMIDGVGQSEGRDAYLEDFCDYYAPPLRSYLHRTLGKRYGLSAERLDDILQEFLLTKILNPKTEANNLSAKYLERRKSSPTASFRGYLIRSMNRFVIDCLRRKDPLVSNTDQSLEGLDLDHFALDWSTQLLEQALQTMEAECIGDGRQDLWGVFRSRFLDPLATNGQPKSLEEIGKALGFETRRAKRAQSHIETAKRRFRQIVRKLVVTHVPPAPDESDRVVFERELGHLLKSARLATVITTPSDVSESISVLQLAQDNAGTRAGEYSPADYSAIWKDLNEMDLDAFVAEIAPHLMIQFQDVMVWGGEELSKVSHLWRHSSPPINLLQAIKAHAKRAGKAKSAELYPFEINVVLYHAAIASAWITTETIITKDRPSAILGKLRLLLDNKWLDNGVRELFVNWQQLLHESVATDCNNVPTTE